MPERFSGMPFLLFWTMNIEEFRDYCLSLPGACEKMPFGKAVSAYDRGLLVFEVAGKWFCFFNVDRFDRCNVKCDPDRAAEWQACCDGIGPAYHMNKRHWISCSLQGEATDAMLRELVRGSYERVVAALPKRVRETLLFENV